MAYRVEITRRAELDLSSIYAAIGSSDAASAWYRGLRNAIRSLRNIPERCPVTPEDPDLRHLLYGNKPHIYRVIYCVLERQKRVRVLHIRHGARQAFQAGELK